MTDQSEINAAKAAEADRLRTDPVFQEAVLTARKSALEALTTVDPFDSAAVTRLQAKVIAIDALTTELANIILRGKPNKGADRA